MIAMDMGPVSIGNVLVKGDLKALIVLNNNANMNA